MHACKEWGLAGFREDGWLDDTSSASSTRGRMDEWRWVVKDGSLDW